MDSIGQGCLYQSQWNKYYQNHQNHSNNKRTNIKSLDSISLGYTPVREGLQNINDENGTVSKESNELTKLLNEFDTKYDEFQQLMATVSKQQENYMQILDQNKRIPSKAKPYLGKIVKNNDTYYYITRFGHTRKFSNRIWEERDKTTCKGPTVQTHTPPTTSNNTPPTKRPQPNFSDIDMNHIFEGLTNMGNRLTSNEPSSVEYSGKVSNEIINILPQGPPMNSNEPCGLEASIVSKGSGEDYSWIDDEGIRHTFPSDQDITKQQSCPTDYTVLSESQYESITIGQSMNTDSKCSVFVDNPSLRKSLETNQAKLLSTTQELVNLLEQIKTDDIELEKEINQRRVDLYRAIHKMENELDHKKKEKQENETLKGRWNNILVDERMQYYRYLGIFGVALVFGGITIHQMTKSK